MFAPFITAVFEPNDTHTQRAIRKLWNFLFLVCRSVVLHSAPDEQSYTAQSNTVWWSFMQSVVPWDGMVSSCILLFWLREQRSLIYCWRTGAAVAIVSFLRQNFISMRCMARQAKSTSMCNGMKHFSFLVLDVHPTHTHTPTHQHEHNKRNRNRDRCKKCGEKLSTGGALDVDVIINVCKEIDANSVEMEMCVLSEFRARNSFTSVFPLCVLFACNFACLKCECKTWI